jgi:hypothetical protein
MRESIAPATCATSGAASQTRDLFQDPARGVGHSPAVREQRQEQLMQAGERQLGLRFHTGGTHDAEARRVGQGHGCLKERALAGAGFAAEHGERGVRGSPQHPLQPREFRLPPDESMLVLRHCHRSRPSSGLATCRDAVLGVIIHVSAGTGR